jgi:hypothetical protein
MKKLIFVIVLALMTVFFAGCGCGEEEDVVIKHRKFLDVPDCWQINVYNGYICSSLDKVKNDDDSYTVTFIFKNIGIE